MLYERFQSLCRDPDAPSGGQPGGSAPPPNVEPPGIDWYHPSLAEFLDAGDHEALTAYLKTLPTHELRRLMAQAPEAAQQRAIQLLSYADAADIIDDLPDEQAADIIEDMPASHAAAILGELDSDDRVDVLAEIGDKRRRAILRALPAEDAHEARALLDYPEDTAGGIMVTEFVAYPEGSTIGQILQDLRRHRQEYAWYNLQYFYVVSGDGVLRGVVRLRDIVLTPPDRPLAEVTVRNPTTVDAEADLDALQRLFEVNTFSALPVVDTRGRLLGVVYEKEVAEASRKRAERTVMKLAGLFEGEELRSQPVLQRVRGRLAWLLLIMALSVAAASVIHLFESTLEQMIALAVFLPVVSGMSGCSGNQAVGLSLRELALGSVHPRDLLYVLIKEARVGVFTGLVLGIVLGVLGYVWRGDTHPLIGPIIGAALAVNTLISVCLGGTIPLLLKRFHLDPAAGSGPIVTTLCDSAGFFTVLGLAALALRYL